MNNIYKTDRIELHLKPMPPLVFTRFQVEFDKRWKPEMPKREVTYVGGKTLLQNDPHDETYKALMQDFESMKFQALVEFCIQFCVIDEPPVDFVVFEGLGDNSLNSRKIVWVLSALTETEDTGNFIGACLGQNQPIEEEIASAQTDFKSGDRRTLNLGLQVQE